MKTILKLFFKWGIEFEKKPYSIPEKAERKIAYCDAAEVERAIVETFGIMDSEPMPAAISQKRMPLQNKIKTQKQKQTFIVDDEG